MRRETNNMDISAKGGIAKMLKKYFILHAPSWMIRLFGNSRRFRLWYLREAPLVVAEFYRKAIYEVFIDGLD